MTSQDMHAFRSLVSYMPDEPHGQQQQPHQKSVVLEVNVVYHEQRRV